MSLPALMIPPKPPNSVALIFWRRAVLSPFEALTISSMIRLRFGAGARKLGFRLTRRARFRGRARDIRRVLLHVLGVQAARLRADANTVLPGTEPNDVGRPE